MAIHPQIEARPTQKCLSPFSPRCTKKTTLSAHACARRFQYPDSISVVARHSPPSFRRRGTQPVVLQSGQARENIHEVTLTAAHASRRLLPRGGGKPGSQIELYPVIYRSLSARDRDARTLLTRHYSVLANRDVRIGARLTWSTLR